jgi:hypothetical protein
MSLPARIGHSLNIIRAHADSAFLASAQPTAILVSRRQDAQQTS